MTFRDYINSQRRCANCSYSNRLGLGITCKNYEGTCVCTRHKMKKIVYQNLSIIYKHLKQ